ncbi:MAG: AraC family transcriptional regulator [Clostridiales bacterium]|nr:AraC family transcriptional regulator [Clostridiales bacterium]
MDNLNDYIPEIGYFTYRKCFPGWEIEKSLIDFHDLSYVVAGQGYYYINGRELPVKAGDALYITPGNTREAKSSDDFMELFAVNFKFLDNGVVSNADLLPFELKNEIGTQPRLIYLFKQLTRIWIEKNAYYTVEARAVTMRIICEMMRIVQKKVPFAAFDPRVEIIKDYINEHYDTRLTLKELARIVDLNGVYLGTLFKKTEGVTINAYINKIRVTHAIDIILIEKANITEAAYRCGFSDAFYFCRVFKKQYGYPPSEIGKHW